MTRGTAVLLLVVVLCALAGPDAARAQAANPTFIGDVGKSDGNQTNIVPKMLPASMNSRKRENDLKNKIKLKDYVKVKLPDGREVDQLTPKEFLDYNKSLGEDSVVKNAPDNKLIVIDMTKWDSLSPADKANLTIKRPVKRTRTYTIAKPIFQERTYITYPCCCPETVKIQVGVTYETKTEVINETEVVGADFPTVEVNVPRDVFFAPDSNYDPSYRTSVPQYACSGSDKAQAKPLVPLATDGRDGLAQSPGSTSYTNEGIPTSSTSDEHAVQLGSALYDCGVFVACTPDGSPFTAGGTTTTTYNGTTIEKQTVAAKIPLGDLGRGMDPGIVNRPGEDKGINTFPTDKAVVIKDAILTNATGDPIGKPDLAPQIIGK
jgi:hypothetical protein